MVNNIRPTLRIFVENINTKMKRLSETASSVRRGFIQICSRAHYFDVDSLNQRVGKPKYSL